MGEPWGEGFNGWWSVVEFTGFVCVAFGVLVYYNVVKCGKAQKDKIQDRPYQMLETAEEHEKVL